MSGYYSAHNSGADGTASITSQSTKTPPNFKLNAPQASDDALSESNQTPYSAHLGVDRIIVEDDGGGGGGSSSRKMRSSGASIGDDEVPSQGRRSSSPHSSKKKKKKSSRKHSNSHHHGGGSGGGGGDDKSMASSKKSKKSSKKKHDEYGNDDEGYDVEQNVRGANVVHHDGGNVYIGNGNGTKEEGGGNDDSSSSSEDDGKGGKTYPWYMPQYWMSRGKLFAFLGIAAIIVLIVLIITVSITLAAKNKPQHIHVHEDEDGEFGGSDILNPGNSFGGGSSGGGGSGGGSTSTSTTLGKIKASGVLNCGVPIDQPGFAVVNPSTKRMEGFDADLVSGCKKRIEMFCWSASSFAVN